MDTHLIKQRFGIIGHSPLLTTALETAVKVAPTDMNVLILGESGVGKESLQQNHSPHERTQTRPFHSGQLRRHT